jgi:hemerythrin-like domain-containing protein
MENVSRIMSQEHEKLDDLFIDFESMLGKNSDDAKELFNKFRWILEKHFFVEEKAIFNIAENILGDEVSDIFNLMDEHGTMAEFLNDIEDDLDEHISPDTSQLKNLLKNHREFEDSVFYPKLDEELSENQKRLIIERAREIIRG